MERDNDLVPSKHLSPSSCCHTSGNPNALASRTRSNPSVCTWPTVQELIGQLGLPANCRVDALADKQFPRGKIMQNNSMRSFQLFVLSTSTDAKPEFLASSVRANNEPPMHRHFLLLFCLRTSQCICLRMYTMACTICLFIRINYMYIQRKRVPHCVLYFIQRYVASQICACMEFAVQAKKTALHCSPIHQGPPHQTKHVIYIYIIYI